MLYVFACISFMASRQARWINGCVVSWMSLLAGDSVEKLKSNKFNQEKVEYMMTWQNVKSLTRCNNCKNRLKRLRVEHLRKHVCNPRRNRPSQIHISSAKGFAYLRKLWWKIVATENFQRNLHTTSTLEKLATFALKATLHLHVVFRTFHILPHLTSFEANRNVEENRWKIVAVLCLMIENGCYWHWLWLLEIEDCVIAAASFPHTHIQQNHKKCLASNVKKLSSFEKLIRINFI